MKLKKRLNFKGIILFFILIAIVIQIAILVYDYIIKRTDNKVLIAVLILNVIIVLSVICTIIDIIRRKIMIDRPVNKILEATHKITKGDFKVRLDINHEYDKYDEYDLIMENLNSMASELEKTEVLKTDFISNVSHEIKTPLAIIQNYVTLLQDDSLDLDTRNKYSKTLLQASKRLSNLITNILKLNKLENQSINVENKEFNLTESLSEIVISFEELIERKNIKLECEFDDVYINSSVSLLEIVWNNLISNAIKFTNESGNISITLKKVDDTAIVRVSDTGCGISQEIGARIFEKFYQGDTSHKQEGNGLGLPLVKKVIDILGAEISVSSEVNKGTTFTITLNGVISK